MKFNRKPATVEVGVMPRESMHGGLLDPSAPPHVGVTTTNGQTFVLTMERFLDEYEPADGDAEVWLDGLQQRQAEADRQRRYPFGQPPTASEENPEPPVVQIEEDGNVLQRMRQIPQEKKRKQQ